MKVDATDQGPYKSVDWQGNAWYRVMGDAGTRIPEYPFTSVQNGYGHCGTWCPGYLPGGSHPQTHIGATLYYIEIEKLRLRQQFVYVFFTAKIKTW